MPFPSALPGEFPEHLRWRTVPIPKEVPLVGYVAGPPIGCWVHHPNKVSRPCVRWFTDNELPCEHCGAVRVRNIAYLPFFLETTWERLVIILSKTTFQAMKAARFLDRFEAIQQIGRCLPARCRPTEGKNVTDKLPPHLRKKGPQDIGLYLLHLWQRQDLEPFVTVEKKNAA